MAVKNATVAADAWGNAGATAGAKWNDGVQSTTKDPGALAAAQVQKMLTNLTQSITTGKWQRRVTEGGPAKWKAAAAGKVPNFVQGFTAGKPNYQAAYAAMQPTMEATQARIENMPKASLADSIARATEWMTSLHAYGQNRS